MCLDGFASNARKAERRLKRGGGVTIVPLDFETAEGEMATHEPAVDADVDELFYREWVRALLERSVADLKRARRDGRAAGDVRGVRALRPRRRKRRAAHVHGDRARR